MYEVTFPFGKQRKSGAPALQAALETGYYTSGGGETSHKPPSPRRLVVYV